MQFATVLSFCTLALTMVAAAPAPILTPSFEVFEKRLGGAWIPPIADDAESKVEATAIDARALAIANRALEKRLHTVIYLEPVEEDVTSDADVLEKRILHRDDYMGPTDEDVRVAALEKRMAGLYANPYEEDLTEDTTDSIEKRLHTVIYLEPVEEDVTSDANSLEKRIMHRDDYMGPTDEDVRVATLEKRIRGAAQYPYPIEEDVSNSVKEGKRAIEKRTRQVIAAYLEPVEEDSLDSEEA